MLTNVSASQVKDYRACNRLWFYTRVLKERPPQTEAQSRGTTVHGALEAHLKAGKIEPDILERAKQLGITEEVLSDYVTAMLPFVGKPGEGLTEYPDTIPTYDGGPPFKLVVDHAREITVENHGVIPQIDDLKTTSDFRYCKTPEELGKDVQMITYAKWAILRLYVEKNNPPPNFVSLRHVYVRTRGKRIATARDTLVTPEHVEAHWNGILDDVRAMAALATAADSALRLGETLDPAAVPATTTDHCSAYGGCYFRSKCFGALYDGSRPFMTLFNKTPTATTEKTTVSENNVVPGQFPQASDAGGPRLSLAERMRLKQAGGAPAVAAPVAPVAPAAAPAAPAAPVAPAAPAAPAAAPAAPIVCGVKSELLNVLCTLVPHTGDHESRSAAGGVVHWSQDGLQMGLGPSENWKPLEVAATSASSDIPNVLPPDAPSRTSTPEEVAAEGERKRKPRRSAAAIAATAAGAAPAPAPAAPVAPAAPAAPVAPVAPAAPVASATGVCPLEVLYIDCFPVKNGGAVPVMAEPLIAELAAAAAQAAGTPDWRLVEFGKGKGAMAVVLRERLANVPREMVVSTSTPGADIVIEVLAPHARKIVKALRG